MGAAASIPDTISAADCKALAGEAFDQARFDKAATDGSISKDQLLAAFMERQRLLTAFQQVDSDGSGEIDKDELGTLLESLDLDTALVEQIMSEVDQDGDGKIDFKEWSDAVLLGTSAFSQHVTNAMSLTGKIVGFLTLDDMYQKRKGQCKDIKAQLEEKPGDADLTAALAKREGQMEMYSAKLKAIAISEEKKLYRVFQQIDVDHSGSIDKAELLEAVKAMNLSMADGEKIYEAICKEQGAENGITFAMFKNACKVGGGRKFEKALTKQIRHGGEIANFQTLEQKLAQYKMEVQTIEAGLAKDPGNEILQDKLSKVKAQGEVMASKLKAIAAADNRKLKEIFDQIDADHSGEIDREELEAAMEALKLTDDNLQGIDNGKLDAIMSKIAPGKKVITFDDFKNGVKLGGGRSFERALSTYVDPLTGKAKGFLSLDELFQKRKAQCKAIKEALGEGGDAAMEANLKRREAQMESLSAKLIGAAISEEKRLYRVFQQIDADRSGVIDADELTMALSLLQGMQLADMDTITASLNELHAMAPDEGITWAKFKEAFHANAGKAFTKALNSKVMHDGKVANFTDMNEMFEKRCTQFAELEKMVEADPDNAELAAELKKVKAQGEVIQAKLRTLACQDEKILKDTFESFDTDHSGKIDLMELTAACKAMELNAIDPAELISSLGEGTEEITFEQWKAAIRVGGGRKFESAITRRVGPDGTFYKDKSKFEEAIKA